MTRSLLTVAMCLLVPSVAAAQYNNAPPPGYYAPPPGYYAPPPAGYPPPGTQYAPAVAPASSANLEGFALSFGLGYGSPLGDIMKNTSGVNMAMSDGISDQIPFTLGAGFRVNQLFSLGLALQYAVLTIKNCDTGSSCSGSDTRLGAEGRFHFAAEQSFSPWLSVGLGYEWLGISETGANVFDLTLKGADFEVQAGGDFRVSPTFVLGPYVGLRAGTYSSSSVSMPGVGAGSADISDANQTTHGWLTFGIRGMFTL
jgi:hypothetical protein